MDTGFFAAFSKKVISTIIAVGSMFYSTIDGVTPNMTLTEITFEGDNCIVSVVITNCYTEQLDQILSSGNEIPLHFNVELFQEGEKNPDSTYSFFHLLKFSPIDDNFKIYISEKNEAVHGLTLQQSKSLFSSIKSLRLLSSKDLQAGTNYYFKITAWLDKIQMQGMKEELNLIYYWNSIKPSISSVIFNKSDFQS
jgi:hypothetical protein